MINYIWVGMIVLGVIFGIINGKITEVSNAIMSGAGEGVSMTISLMGIMCFWTGMMEIAKNSGITNLIAKLLSPLIRLIFPKLRDERAKNYIVMNMSANMLGMSNCATPLGIKAVKRLKEISKTDTATDEMCMFTVINTASIQLIPSTVMAIRQSLGSANSSEIMLPVWLCSLCAVTVGVISAKIFGRLEK